MDSPALRPLVIALPEDGHVASRLKEEPHMTQAMTSEEVTAVSAPGEFHRGWPTLVFSTIGAGVGLSALGYILGTLVVPLQEEFGWG